ncbi:FAD binding domain-containing protein [Leptodontidium sp. 2 PMI_412]|nr:FAD binding domain-containing protein [Leptodontidium sp. 2 PMI_412]
MKNFLVAALLPLLASSQTIVVDNTSLPVDGATVAPAVLEVDASSSNATADLFPSETLQLTDAVIANLTDLELSNITLFSFEDSPANKLRKRTIFGKCKTYAGDFLYPSTLVWKVFDVLLGGALIKTVPYAAPCYDDFGNFNKAKCDFLTSNWANGSIYHTEDPTSVNGVLFQGLTCMPPALIPTPKECTVGGYPSYAVAVKNVAQIQLTVNLARSLNLRLVIKNTGHDFGAKSTGMGALSIWTHNLKSVQFMKTYKYGSYSGPAFKVGSGIQAFEIYEAAKANGVTVVGGEGRTVGVTGGYILGGGHSPLSSIYGMAVDQVLSMEVVTADGRFVTASPTSNADLFWALSGGGGSTFGVVSSMVIKAHPKIKVTTMTYVLQTADGYSSAAFWQALRIFFDGFIKYTDAGNYEYFRITSVGPDAYYSDMGPWFAPGMSKAELQALVAPMFAQWAAIGVVVEPVYTEYDNYYDAWHASFPVEPWGSNAIRQGSRLFPKSNWLDQGKLNMTFDAIKTIVEDGAYIIAFNIAAAPKSGFPDNGVNPAWRETVLHCITATFWDPAAEPATIKAISDKLTFDWGKKLIDASPGAGAYMSESDYIEPNFTQSFFGSKYAKLRAIKRKYDPYDLFYAQNAVGSEDWQMSEMIMGNLPSQNSKLCRK